jgi:outer membrane protein assembly factor BamA
VLYWSVHSFGQTILVHYSFKDAWIEKQLPDSVFSSAISAKKYMATIQNKNIENGFLLSSFVTLAASKDSILHVVVYTGPKFETVTLTVDSNEQSFLKKKGVFHSEIKFRPKALKNYMTLVRDSYLNNGYPFVSVELVHSRITENNNLFGELKINRGDYYTWGNIIVKGDSSISGALIQNITGIKTNKVYNESLINQLDKEFSSYSYLEQVKKPEFLYTTKEVDVYFYMKTKPNSSVNGAIGIQQNPVTLKASLTGQIQLKLQNGLKKGELIDLNWRSIQPGTQNLSFIGNLPFLFKSKFGIDGKFTLYKRDSTFLEIKSSLGISYQLKNNFYLKGIYSFNSSDILSTTFNSQLNSTKSNLYGISIYRKAVDYLPNPTKGILFSVDFAIGNRKTSTNPLNNSSSRGGLMVERYNKITKRQVIKLGFYSEWLFNDQTYANERIRFGGLNSLRGFNEEELYATSMFSGLVEYRFLLDKNSNVFVFYNQSWYEDNSVGIYRNDSPFGFGTGFSFGTKLGIFSITYALGKQFQNTVQFNQGKIHIGYVAYF